MGEIPCRTVCSLILCFFFSDSGAPSEQGHAFLMFQPGPSEVRLNARLRKQCWLGDSLDEGHLGPPIRSRTGRSCSIPNRRYYWSVFYRVCCARLPEGAGKESAHALLKECSTNISASLRGPPLQVPVLSTCRVRGDASKQLARIHACAVPWAILGVFARCAPNPNGLRANLSTLVAIQHPPPSHALRYVSARVSAVGTPPRALGQRWYCLPCPPRLGRESVCHRINRMHA